MQIFLCYILYACLCFLIVPKIQLITCTNFCNLCRQYYKIGKSTINLVSDWGITLYFAGSEIIEVKIHYRPTGRQILWHQIWVYADFFFQLNLLHPYLIRSQGDKLFNSKSFFLKTASAKSFQAKYHPDNFTRNCHLKLLAMFKKNYHSNSYKRAEIAK